MVSESGELRKSQTIITEYEPLYQKVRVKYDALITEIETSYERLKGIEVQKDFALEATKTKCSGALFALRAGKVASAKEYLAGLSMQGIERHISVSD